MVCPVTVDSGMSHRNKKPVIFTISKIVEEWQLDDWTLNKKAWTWWDEASYPRKKIQSEW